MRTREEIEMEIAEVIAAGRRMNNLQNEGAGGYDHTDAAKREALTAELNAAIDAEWTAEITATRRAIFNEAVTRLLNPVKAQKETGIDLYELRLAVERHGA